MTKTIELTQGKSAIVDDQDYENLNQYKWHYSNHGYAARMVRKKQHRSVTFMQWYIVRPLLNTVIDHINGDRLDNRRCNLRMCKKEDNNKNRRVNKSKTSSQYKGVTWRKHAKAWKAYIKLNQKQIHLGYFKNEFDAAIAYNKAAEQLFGEFACLNEVTL